MTDVTMYTYDVYEAGAVYGEAEMEITPELVAKWHKAFESDRERGTAPIGLIVLLQQKAYKDIVTPRPPGHIQGGQHFEVLGLLRAGDKVTTTVSCVDKEVRNGRRWVRMGFEGRTANEIVFKGINTILVPM